MELDNVDDILPLAPMQELMLMHSSRIRGSSTLVNQFCFRLVGELDLDRFGAAWQRAVDRHAMLRTVFVHEGVERPVQVVRSRAKLETALIDLSGYQDKERSSRVAEHLMFDRERGFDLLHAPLMRTTLMRIAAREHLFVWTRHHLILDLWSVELLFKEIFAEYEAPSLPGKAAGHFRDYLEWLQQQDQESLSAHWRSYLSGFRNPSLLFTERGRRSEWSSQGQPIVRECLDRSVTEQIKATARLNNLTLGSIFQGALALLMASRLGQDGVIFGLTVAGRPQGVDNVENILGSFINNVPVCARIRPGDSVWTWLDHLQRGHAARLPYEHASLIDIQRWSELPAKTPLFDVLLLLESPFARAPSSGSLTVEAVEGPFDSALPLTIAVDPRADRIAVTVVHDDTIIDGPSTRRFAVDFCELLTRLASCREGVLADFLPDSWSPETLDRGNRNSPGDDGPDPADTASGEDFKDPSAVLLDIWRDALGVPAIGPDDDFFALGGTSIQAALAFAEIERRLGRALPLSMLFEAGSVRELSVAMELPPPPPGSLVSIQRFGSRPPILAASGIDGNVVGLVQLARALGETQPFFGLQSKVLSGGDPPMSTIEEIAADFIHESDTVRDSRHVLAGICFGANVMLEMARQLASSGCPPAMLVVMDPVFNESTDNGFTVAPGRTAALFGFLGGRLSHSVNALRTLDAAGRRDFLARKSRALLEKLRHRNLAYGNEFELRQRQVSAAHLQAARAYVPRLYDGEVRVLLTADRELVPQDDPRLRWVRHVAPHAQVVEVPGKDTGDSLHQHAAVLADRLRHWIDEITPGPQACDSHPKQGSAILS